MYREIVPLQSEVKTDYTEAEYPFLVHDVMLYIDEMKKINLKKEHPQNLSLIDIIMEFAFRKNIDVEVVGDAIAGDIYFKSFIEKDCEMHKIFITKNSKNNQLNESW